MKKEALLLIDIQDVYFTPGPLLLNRPEEAAKKAEVLLNQFRKEGKVVIHVRHNFKNLSGIHESVKPIEGEKIIQKDFPSSFLKTDLQEYLKENEIEHIVISGMMSHMCIDTTVRACQNYGYEVTLIEDACTTQDLQYRGNKIPAQMVHEVFMASLNGKFAKVMTLEEFNENKK